MSGTATLPARRFVLRDTVLSFDSRVYPSSEFLLDQVLLDRGRDKPSNAQIMGRRRERKPCVEGLAGFIGLTVTES